MTERTLYVVSASPIKVGVAQEMAEFMSHKEGIVYRVESIDVPGGTDRDGRIVPQPFGQTTYDASRSRISSALENGVDRKGDNVIISFENGIDMKSSTDFCVMTVLSSNSEITQYTSFGIQIDVRLFSEYLSQLENYDDNGASRTFGSFLSSKIRGVTSNNWMSDIRFGNVDRKVQLLSCVDQFYLNRYARYIPNFPREGVMFKDITPVMTDAALLARLYAQLQRVVEYNFDEVDYFAGLDARGFYFAPALAHMMGKGFIPIRKAGKLPVNETDRKDPTKLVIESYSTEYSEDEFGLIPDEAYVGKRVLILDDLLATGGSIVGASNVLMNAGLSVVGGLTVYDVQTLREDAIKKLKCLDGFKMIVLVAPNLKAQSVLYDTKKVSHPMTDVMIQRLREPPHFDAEEIDDLCQNDNGSIFNSDISDEQLSTNAPKLSRRYTLSSKDWFDDQEYPNKLKRVRVLYTEKDEQIAKSIIRVLVADQDPETRERAIDKFGVRVKSGQFPNGESHAFIKQNIRNCHVFIVSRIRTNHINDDLMELYLIMDACNRSGVGKKTVIIPYYPYSRSDKKDAPRTHIGAAVQASFLNDLVVDNLISLDLHAGQIQGLISRGFHNLYLQNYLAEYIYANYLRYYPESVWNNKFVLIAPDAGSTKAIKSYSKIFKIDNIALDKTRNYAAAEDGKSAVNKVRFIGDRSDFEGKVGLIIDDIGDTMGTMSAAVETLVENGLDSAIVFVTHGVLSGPAMDRINSNNHIKEVVVSDSLPQDQNKKLSPKLRVVSIAELLGRTIDGILTGRSISRLFE